MVSHRSNPSQSKIIYDSGVLAPASQERHQLLSEWASAPWSGPVDEPIHQIFERRAEASPHAIALTFADQNLTYGELNRQANQLAHHLRAQGVGPDVLVGLCVERSLEMVVGLLGILKAGGAYVPLDASYPAERLAFMLADTAVPVLLTQTDLVARLPAHTAQVICLDALGAEYAGTAAGNPPCVATGESLAYVMYTSGSTGRPKGVLVPQRGVVRLVCGNDFARFSAQEVFLQLAPLAFDASTFEIWGALLNGARLVIMAPGTPLPHQIGAAIRRHGVTTVWLTAGLFHFMVQEHLDELRPLRQLLAGGDALSAAHVQAFIRAVPHCQLINGYGPTENTTFTTTHALTAATGESEPVLIGRPIGGTEVYILDEHLQPVAVGVTGELYTGGAGLARGYLNQPELTAERFIAHPFSSDPTARLYRTGDLARYRPDGKIEFIGRADNQVKIRGFRIELGEIEAALGQHPAVREAIVLAREDAPGDKRLVAYIVPALAVEAADLRTWLKQKLPDYMIPAAFVTLERLPLTPNGKVDRKALPAPESTLAASRNTAYLAPRNPIEAELAQIWAELLRTPQVGVHDNFFMLGGHSLLAAQVLSRVRNHFQVELPLRAMFEAVTVAELAAAIERSRETESRNLDQIVPQPGLTATGSLDVEELSDEQVQAMLLAMLEQDGADQ